MAKSKKQVVFEINVKKEPVREARKKKLKLGHKVW